MQIRRLEKEEIEDAILFATRKKPEDFMQILNRCMRDQLFYWGYYEGEQLCGVIAATCEGFLTTLYVSPGKSRQLMQKQLLEYAGHILKSIYEVNQITVTVDIKEQAGYEQLGFESILTDRAMEENGQALISLKYTIRPTTITQGNVQKTFDKRKVAVIIGIIVVVLAIIGGIIWYYESQDTGGTGGILPQIQEPKEEEDVEPTQTAEAAGVGDEDYKPENVEDITKVEPYIGTDVTYGVKTDTYEMKEDKDTVNLDFQAQYPVLEQLSGEYAEQINTLIQNTALSTVNLLYLNPTDLVKHFCNTSV